MRIKKPGEDKHKTELRQGEISSEKERENKIINKNSKTHEEINYRI